MPNFLFLDADTGEVWFEYFRNLDSSIMYLYKLRHEDRIVYLRPLLDSDSDILK